MRRLKWICICTLILIWVFLFVCRRKPGQGPVGVKTIQILWSACINILIMEQETDQKPPVILSELVSWLIENGVDPEYDDYINAEERTILDSWGRSIVLISDDSRLTALGSKGPDGKWEGGKGDDIVVRLEEVRK